MQIPDRLVQLSVIFLRSLNNVGAPFSGVKLTCSAGGRDHAPVHAVEVSLPVI